jgi:hypothetical protein
LPPKAPERARHHLLFQAFLPLNLTSLAYSSGPCYHGLIRLQFSHPSLKSFPVWTDSTKPQPEFLDLHGNPEPITVVWHMMSD